MTTYAQMTTEELQSELASLQDTYNRFKAKGYCRNNFKFQSSPFLSFPSFHGKSALKGRS